MDKKKSYEIFLEGLGKSQSSISSYTSAFSFNNKIANELGLGDIESWDLNNVD